MAAAFSPRKLGGGHKHIVVASNDAGLAQAVVAELNSKKRFAANDRSAGAGNRRRPRQALTKRVDAKDVDGYLWLQTQPGKVLPDATYVSRGSADLFTASGSLESAVNRAIMREQLSQARSRAPAKSNGLLERVDLKTTQVKDGKTSSSDTMKSFFGAYHHGLPAVLCHRSFTA